MVPPREASTRNLARAYHAQARHLTLDPSIKALAGPHAGTATTTLPQRTLAMAGAASATAPPPPAAAATTATSSTAAATAPAPSAEPAPCAEPRLPPHTKIGGSRDSLLEMSTSGIGRSQKQGAGAYSKSYTLV